MGNMLESIGLGDPSVLMINEKMVRNVLMKGYVKRISKITNQNVNQAKWSLTWKTVDVLKYGSHLNWSKLVSF